MGAPFLGRDELLDAVAEEDDAHLVVVGYGAESQRGGHLGGEFLLELVVGAEAVASAHVHQQHHRQLAFLLEHLDVGVRQTRRHVPVDAAHVVAVLVFAHLAEHHAATLERRVVLAAEHLLRQPPRLDFNLADLLYYIFVHSLV